MIVNAWTVLYLLLSVVSLVAGLAGVVAGIWILPRWRRTRVGTEERYELERVEYLVTTLGFLVLLMRLAMTPLWFWTLSTLVPSVPGAMCLTGVHMVEPAIAFPATIIQFILPGVYVAWLMWQGLDDRDRKQPFAILRFRALSAIGVLLIITAALEAAGIMTVRPRIVGCCTSLFDEPREAVPDLIEGSTWVWTVAAAGALAATLAGLRLRCGRLRIGLALAAPAGLLLLLLALHTRLAPDILHAPYHHCVFCLWRDSWGAVIGSAAVIAGYWMAFGLAFMGRDLSDEAARFENRAARRAAGLLVFGALLLAALELTA